MAQGESRRARPRARVPETDGAVGVEPPRTRNRPRPYPRPHPDVLAAVGAVRAALDALAQERLAVDPPGRAGLRGISCHPGDVAGALGGRMLTTLASPDPAPVPPRPAPGGLRCGGSYASEGVRGSRPPERRPGS